MRARIFTIWLLAYILGSMIAPLFESVPDVYLYLGLALVASSFFIYRMRYVFAVIFGIGLLFISIGTFQRREVGLFH